MVCTHCKKPLIGVKVVDDTDRPIESSEETMNPKMTRKEVRQESFILRSQEGQHLEIKRDGIIGREGDIGKDYLSQFDTISRKHCEVLIKVGKLFIKDLESTNGVFINGIKISPYTETLLEKGSQVSFGSSVIFTLE